MIVSNPMYPLLTNANKSVMVDLQNIYTNAHRGQITFIIDINKRIIANCESKEFAHQRLFNYEYFLIGSLLNTTRARARAVILN